MRRSGRVILKVLLVLMLNSSTVLYQPAGSVLVLTLDRKDKTISFCGKFRNRLLRRRRPAGTVASGADFTPFLRRTFDILERPISRVPRAVSNLFEDGKTLGGRLPNNEDAFECAQRIATEHGGLASFRRLL